MLVMHQLGKNPLTKNKEKTSRDQLLQQKKVLIQYDKL